MPAEDFRGEQAVAAQADQAAAGDRTVELDRWAVFDGRQRSWPGRDSAGGELQVDEAGSSLHNATAKVTRASRPGNGQPADAGEACGSYGDEPPF